jgi:hypothetical protein
VENPKGSIGRRDLAHSVSLDQEMPTPGVNHRAELSRMSSTAISTIAAVCRR